MNIRCAFCQTPYTLSRVAMLDALQEVDSKKLSHYDAHCPRCRRATRIPRQRLEMAMPNWREELKQFEKEMKEHPQHEAPLPQAESTPAAEPASTSEPSAKKEATKASPAAAPVEAAARKTGTSADSGKGNSKSSSKAKKSATQGTSKKSK